MHANMTKPANTWGPWRYDPRANALYLPRTPDSNDPNNDLYWIDLDTIHDDDSINQWIDQLSAKRWATRRILNGLRAALTDLTATQAEVAA